MGPLVLVALAPGRLERFPGDRVALSCAVLQMQRMIPKRHRHTPRCVPWPPCWCLMVLLTGCLRAAGRPNPRGIRIASSGLCATQRDCPLEIHEHGLSLAHAHGGTGAEYLRFTAGQGTHIYLQYDLTPSFVIHELECEIWPRSDRLGPRVPAAAVLPRVRQQDGQPLRLLLRGDAYAEAGSWQRLQVRDARRLLQREIINYCAERTVAIDARDAYVDALILDVYSGPGLTQVWIDDLDVQGQVPVPDERRHDTLPEGAASQSQTPVAEVPLGPRTHRRLPEFSTSDPTAGRIAGAGQGAGF